MSNKFHSIYIRAEQVSEKGRTEFGLASMDISSGIKKGKYCRRRGHRQRGRKRLLRKAKKVQEREEGNLEE